MCGLFGFSAYCDQPIKKLSMLTNSLAEQSAVRGIDATGIAYGKNGGMTLYKEPKSAYLMDFKHPDDTKSLIGHTRHSTQGSEKKNWNNHPFFGKTRNGKFVLAHNGVLTNDDELKLKYSLPKTKIETDSFVAVQLIEQMKYLNFASLKHMAENVEGSFSFSIMDTRNNIYLVKGDSPITLLHFPKERIYVYASTDAILYKALVDSFLFDSLKERQYEQIELHEGDILKIRSDGQLENQMFDYQYYRGCRWYDFGWTPHLTDDSDSRIGTSYIDDLKRFAMYQGFPEDAVEALIEDGLTPEEVEEYLYECG